MAYYAPFYRPNYYTPVQQMPDMLNQMQQPYQQQTPMQNQQAMPAPPVGNNDIIWVQGEAGAKAYLVAPNNTVTLWDSENQTIYVKSADASGIPSMRTLDWVERNASGGVRSPDRHECKCSKDFVSKSDFEALKQKLEDLERDFDDLWNRPRRMKEEIDNV